VRNGTRAGENRRVRIGILGPLEVLAGDGPREVGGARLRALLTRLALEPGRIVPPDRLIDDLWDDRPPAGAPNALQSLVSRLRATLGNGREIIESRPAGYRLTLEPAAIDAFEFESRLAAARQADDPAEVRELLCSALALWRGPALADVAGAAFAEGPIARLEGLRSAALEERIESDLRLGRYAELIPELEALTAADPLRESLQGRLMRALYGAGRQAEALAVYETTQRALADELGLDPSEELQRLHLQVLRHDPALGAAQPERAREPADDRVDLLGASVPLTNLRSRLTSFIGRESDLARVGKMLADGRLVTLTGPGGAGKTRLSVEAGARILERSPDDLPDGVWLVELAPVLDPAEVPHAALTVLGLRDAVVLTPVFDPAEITDPLDRLAAGLAGKRLLLLLDNCEHVIDAAARLADRLLADCPGVRVLATSREPLGITGETLWPVESLALPPADSTADDVLEYPAVRLLADRAAAVRPGFAVTPDNVADVTAICRALDGMPLAIELAAARLRALTPAQVAARLNDRFRLLTGGSRTALPRHQTLRAVVEWSWDLLDGPERALWRRFAIFAGGATLESVEAVCGGDLDSLTALVDKSLVVATENGRYRMLETIRAYGLERLAEADEEELVRRAHAEHFLAVLEASEPDLRGRGQIPTLRRLVADHDNLHAALRWAVAAGDGPLAIRLCASMGWYWWLRGHRAEGADAAAAVLAMPDLPDDHHTAMAFTMNAITSFGSARDMEETVGWLRRGRRIIEGLPDDEPIHPFLRLVGPLTDIFQAGIGGISLADLEALLDEPDLWLRSMAEFMYGQAVINMGRADQGGEHFEVALAGFRELGERWGTAFTLTALAEQALWRGDYRGGIELCEEGLRLLNELGSGEDVPHVYAKLAHSYWHVGERDRAKEMLAIAVRLAERSGSPEMLAMVEYQLAEFARYEGRLAEAARRMDRALELSRPLSGPPQFRAMILTGRAVIQVAVGALERARDILTEALTAALSSADAPIIALVLAAGYGDFALAEGRPEKAAEFLGIARTLRGMPDLSQADVIRVTKTAEAALGDGYAAAFDRGARLTLDEVLESLGIERPPPAVPVI
jgi:predicted ATPase/DNA-binding SARP family transcriptional activator